MKTSRAAIVFLALGSLTALPACSNMKRDLGMGNQGTAPQTAAASGMQPELDANTLKHVQTALKQDGEYSGNIDGLWGANTQDALRSYQQKHNLTANGQLDAPTLRALNIPEMNNANAGNMANGMNGAPNNANHAAPGNSTPPDVAAPPTSGPTNAAPNQAPATNDMQ